jgi:hypothetical protein
MEVPALLADRIEEARKRLQSHRRWRAWLTYSLPVCGACLVLAVVSRIVYFPYSAAVVAGCGACGLAVSAVLAARVRVDSFTAAARLDLAEGLRERLSTVTECAVRQASGEVIEALVADARAKAADCAPSRSLVFQAPRSLPVTLGLAIAVTALVISPRAFGRAESSLPAIERIALHESIRLNATLKLLNERNMPSSITEPMKKLKEDLEEGKVASARLRLAAFRTQLEQEAAQVEQRDAVLEAMRESDALEKLAELLSAGEAPAEVGAQAGTGFEKDPSGVKEALQEVLDRLRADSELRKAVEEAFEAAKKRDTDAFVKAMEKLGRKMASLPGAQELKMAGARLESLEQKLGKPGDPHRGNPGAPGPAGPPGEGAAVPEIAAQTALEEAIEREKVPERFRNLVKVYFARSQENKRR